MDLCYSLPFRRCRFPVAIMALLAWMLSAPALRANLIRNGGFNEPGAVTSPQPPLTRPDTRIPSWYMRAQWYVDQEQPSPVKGLQVFRADGGGENRQLFQYTYLEPGKKYTLSAWIKAQGLTRTSPRLKDNQTGVIVTDARWTRKFGIELDSKDLSEWKRYQATFTAPKANLVGGIAQPCTVRVFVPKGEKGILWVTGIQIEEGENASSFKQITQLHFQEAGQRLSEIKDALNSAHQHLSEFEGGSREFLVSELEELQKEATSAEAHSAAFLQDEGNPDEWYAYEKTLDELEEKSGKYSQPFAWWDNPWEDLPARALPHSADQMEKREIRILRAVNDYGALLLPVANPTGESISVEVKVGEDEAPLSTVSLFQGPIRVSTACWVSNDGVVNSMSPVRQHHRYPYFLQELPQSNVTTLSPRETTQLWFDISTKEMPPGTYRYPVMLIGLDRNFRWKGNITLEILPVTLPKKVPSTVLAFSNMPFYMPPFNPHGKQPTIANLPVEERKRIARPWLEAWEEMGFNRLMLTNQFIKYPFDREGRLKAPVDYTLFDAYHQLWSQITDQFWAGWNLAAYHVYPNHRDLSQIKFDEVSKNRTKEVLKSFVDHARSLGISPESMPICLFDEPHGKRIDVTRQGLDALRKVAPDWKTMAAVVATDRSHVEDLLPLLDIFVVRQRMGEMDMKPDTIKYLQEHGKEVWGYACSGSFDYLHPYRYFRLLPWQSWSNGMTGYALYMNFKTDQYRQLSAKSAFFSPLFLGRHGPVIGKGARGFQAGGKDWSLFTLAKAEIHKRRENGENAETLETLLSDALNEVVANENDNALAEKLRTRLLQELHRLQADTPSQQMGTRAAR